MKDNADSPAWGNFLRLRALVDTGKLATLKPLALKVWVVLLKHADGVTGEAYPGGELLMLETGCKTHSRILTAIRQLESEGLLDTIDPGGWPDRPAVRRLLVAQGGSIFDREGGRSALNRGVDSRSERGVEIRPTNKPINKPNNKPSGDDEGKDGNGGKESKTESTPLIDALLSIGVSPRLAFERGAAPGMQRYTPLCVRRIYLKALANKKTKDPTALALYLLDNADVLPELGPDELRSLINDRHVTRINGNPVPTERVRSTARGVGLIDADGKKTLIVSAEDIPGCIFTVSETLPKPAPATSKRHCV